MSKKYRFYHSILLKNMDKKFDKAIDIFDLICYHIKVLKRGGFNYGSQ